MPKGCVWRPCSHPLFAAARAAGRPIIVDPKVRDFALYRGATVLTPNVAEVERASGRTVDQPEALAQAVQTLLQHSQAEAMLVTRGKDGMSLFQPSPRPRCILPPRRVTSLT